MTLEALQMSSPGLARRPVDSGGEPLSIETMPRSVRGDPDRLTSGPQRLGESGRTFSGANVDKLRSMHARAQVMASHGWPGAQKLADDILAMISSAGAEVMTEALTDSIPPAPITTAESLRRVYEVLDVFSDLRPRFTAD